MPEGVQFDEETDPSLLYSRLEPSSKTPKMVSFVVNKGWAKDDKSAMWVLLGVVAVAVVASMIFITAGGDEVSLDPISPPERDLLR